MIFSPKTIFLSCILFFLSSVPCYSLYTVSEQSNHPDPDSLIKTSVSVQFGMLQGLIEENVFSSGLQISKLDWNMESLYFLGATFNFQVAGVLYLNFGYWSGFNRDIGLMTDSDYVDETLYLFSEHTNTLQKLYIFDANAGYTQKIFKPWSVTAFIGYNSVSAKMAARNGYLEYPVGSDPEPFYGTGIANEHNYQIAYLGIGTTFSFFDIIYIQFFARYSPLVYCQGIDFHYRREIDFFTNMEGGDYLSFTGVIGWKINENLTAILSVHYTDIKTNLGESYYVDLATGFESEPSAQTSSASYNSTSFTISFEHSLTWINKPDKFPDKKPEKNSKPVEGDIESPL